MKSATTIIRKVLGFQGVIYSDGLRANKPQFRKRVSIKLPFTTLTQPYIDAVIAALAQEGFVVEKHYFHVPKEDNRYGVEGHRFIVGYPKEAIAKIIEHPATTALKTV